MSADALTAALQRIAALEAEVSRSRKSEPQFNQEAFVRAVNADPVGVLGRLGVNVDFATKVFVAHALGDQAPPELKALAAMGPQVSHVSALDSKLEQLSRQVSSVVESQSKKGTRESFKTLAQDKTKYPRLAEALQADPSFFDDELESFGGSAEELAAKLEARQSKVAKIYAPPPPASDEDADTSGDTEAPADEVEEQAPPSVQRKPATAGLVPALPKAKAGVLTPDEDAKLREEIIRKYSSKAGAQ